MITTQPKGMTGSQIKLLALIFMVLDHIHYFFEFTGKIPLAFTMLGRLSAPLFLFCTVEGFAHTHSRKRYFLRIYAISAVMGLVEFFGLYGGIANRADGFFPVNAIMMDFVVLMAVWQGIDWLRAGRILPGLAAILGTVGWGIASQFLSLLPGMATPVGLLCFTLLPNWLIITDGGWFFLLGGVLLYALRGSRWQLPVWAAETFLAYFVLVWKTYGVGSQWQLMFTAYFEWFGVFAVLFMALYNGRRGGGPKRLYYWFYPAHVYLLYGLSCLLYPVLR